MISDRRYREIAGVFLFLLGALLLLSLCTYSSSDYDLLKSGKSVNNLIGPLGAWLGNIFRIAFGYPSLLLCILLFISGWHLIKKGTNSVYLERMFALGFGMISLSPLFAMFESSALPQNAGGFIGLYLYRFFLSFSGKVGAALVVIILNITGLILLGLFSFDAIISSAAHKKLFSLFKTIYGYILLKIKRDPVPLTKIAESLNKKKGKPPWIEKRKVALYHGRIITPIEDEISERPPRLLEYTDPLDTQETNPSSADDRIQLKEDIALNSIPVDISTVLEDDNSEDFYKNETESNAGETEVNAALAHLTNTQKITTNRFRIAEIEEEEALPDGEIGTGNAYNADITPPEKSVVDEAYRNVSKKTEVRGVKNGPDIQQTFLFGVPELDNSPVGSKIFDEIAINRDYIIPTVFLQSSMDSDSASWKSEVHRNSELLVNTLREFGIESRVSNVNRGPVITLYEMQIAPGIKVNRIVGLADDIAMALSGSRVRIVAPIPGKSAIGVEVPNQKREMVTLGDLIGSKECQNQHGYLKVGLGKDILGKPVMLDLKKLPHLLIAGATGSGKSVCVNSIITSLIYNYDPNYVRFILVDPKMVELQLYNGIPHLLTPVITEPHVAPKALKWAMFEMERRYRLLSEVHTRDIERYNQKINGYGTRYEHLPYIVIIMDEMADLMMVASKEIEGFVTRIAQKARAVGIHLVLATQRPSVDVITGVIKANFPARIAFQVAQKTDSRTIIDQNGAEKLLGKGDMLYQSPMSSFPVRIQGTYISEEEIMTIVQHLRSLGTPRYIDIDENLYEEDTEEDGGNDDELFVEALKIVEETKKASASYLQRRLSIGYNRAARIIELMEERGYVGPQQGSKPREVFV